MTIFHYCWFSTEGILLIPGETKWEFRKVKGNRANLKTIFHFTSSADQKFGRVFYFIFHSPACWRIINATILGDWRRSTGRVILFTIDLFLAYVVLIHTNNWPLVLNRIYTCHDIYAFESMPKTLNKKCFFAVLVTQPFQCIHKTSFPACLCNG